MISVVVPVYNAECYLVNCIESLLNQKYSDFELLLIDDGSIDASGEICEKYAQKDIRIKVFHKKNGGVSSARNLGIQNAKYDFVCFVDSDDTVSVTYLSNLMLENDADLVISGLAFCSDRICEKSPSSFYSGDVKDIGRVIPELEQLMLLNGPYHKRYKKKKLLENNILFDTRISHGEDTLFVLSYMQYVFSLKVCESCDYFYNQAVPTSITKLHAEPEEAFVFASEMYRLRKEMCKRFGIIDKEYLKFVQSLYQEYLFVSIHALYYHRIEKSERIRFLEKVYDTKGPIRYGTNKKVENVLSTVLYKIGIPKLSDFLYRQVLWGNRKF